MCTIDRSISLHHKQFGKVVRRVEKSVLPTQKTLRVTQQSCNSSSLLSNVIPRAHSHNKRLNSATLRSSMKSSQTAPSLIVDIIHNPMIASCQRVLSTTGRKLFDYADRRISRFWATGKPFFHSNVQLQRSGKPSRLLLMNQVSHHIVHTSDPVMWGTKYVVGSLHSAHSGHPDKGNRSFDSPKGPRFPQTN